MQMVSSDGSSFKGEDLMTKPRSRSYWIGLSLQAAIALGYCAWVLSMPVFPSQDGPLHLYCVEVFRQLLAHHSGPYAQTYFINRYVPPYSLYYYGLIGLGKMVSLSMADKLIVCSYFVIMPLGLRSLVRSIAGSADWTPLLFMPVLLSWPLMMGFVNFCIALGFACFALSIWTRNQTRGGLRARVPFLLWLVLILLTHPVPWMFVLGFCFFDLGLRLLRFWVAHDRTAARDRLGFFRADLLSALAGCLGYLYLLHFRSPLPPNDPIPYVPLVQRTLHNASDYVRTRGLTLYAGTHGVALVYRLAIALVFAGTLLVAIRFGVPMLRERRWSAPVVWLLFSVFFLLVLPTIPTELNGSYYFAWRLLFLLFLCVVVASSVAMEHPGRVRLVLVTGAIAASVVNIWMAARLISPQARLISSVMNAPLVPSEKPGLVMWPAGGWRPEQLTFNPEEWGAANYFREHNLVLYNTSWMYIEIIPIKPLPDRLPQLEYKYEIQVPRPGGPLMRTPEEARGLLDRVGFVLAMRINTPPWQSPFSDVEGGTTPGAWAAGWICDAQPAWSLCVPAGGRWMQKSSR